MRVVVQFSEIDVGLESRIVASWLIPFPKRGVLRRAGPSGGGGKVRVGDLRARTSDETVAAAVGPASPLAVEANSGGQRATTAVTTANKVKIRGKGHTRRVEFQTLDTQRRGERWVD